MTTYAVTDPKKRFFIHQGEALWSLEDLFTELQTMEHHQFEHHVNDQKHDFASWINDCFNDRFLAKKLEDARTLEDVQKTIFVSLFK